MLFNSVDFCIFLPIVFLLHWTLGRKNRKVQNAVLLVASYFFYGYWDWWFLTLLFISSATDFVVAHQLDKTSETKTRKWLLAISLSVNLGILFLFKYFDFFIGSFIDGFSFGGVQFSRSHLSIVLPIGISFYTLQTLSYTIDVYKKRIPSSQNWVEFFTYVSFFPQLAAGPIERAGKMLPQFAATRQFDYAAAKDGMRQILLGLFKKIAIADACGRQVDLIFSDYQNLDGSTLFLGAVYFLFQVYGDFSGYSDMAIGIGRLFGLNLSQNFRFPFLSRNPNELWQRWHISLSTWFRDYVYIPLGGNRGSEFRTQINLFLVFLISGLWHGAYWTFIVWGAVHGLVLLVHRNYSRLTRTSKLDTQIEVKRTSKFKHVVSSLSVFLYFSLSSIFFRSATVSQAIDYFQHIVSWSLFSLPQYNSKIFILTPFMMLEWFQRDKKHALQIDSWSPWQRWLTYYILMAFVAYYFTSEQSYIYFQF